VGKPAGPVLKQSEAGDYIAQVNSKLSRLAKNGDFAIL
jgi:hypothetical protein